MIKLAMIKIHERVGREGLPLEMILQIHDELLFECPETFREEALDLVRSEMEQVIELRVPLRVDAGSGKSWQEAH